MIKKLYLIGKGGYGNHLSNMLKKDKVINRIIFVDDKIQLNIVKFSKLVKKNNFSISIGSPKIREHIFSKVLKSNFEYVNLIFSYKQIYSKKLKNGNIIEPDVGIGTNSKIGIGNLIFSGSIIGHDVEIGNFCNLGCNVVISGNVKIGNKVQIGANSFISNHVKICSDTTISPGSVILKDIVIKGIYKDNIKIK